MLKNLIIGCLFLAVSAPLFSQQTAVFTNQLVAFNQAVELYNNDQYLAAQRLFSSVKQTAASERVESDCAYYIATCAVRLNQQDADQLMTSFVSSYPTSVKRNAAYIDVANYYFENARFSYARNWYDKVDVSGLSDTEKQRTNFNKGYAYFKSNEFTQAKKYLNQVITSEKYGSQAKYYLGYIAYEANDYEEANELFEEVKDKARYSKDMSYYQADMNFKLGKFQEAIVLGKAQFERSSPKEKSALSKIIGESYFNLGEYPRATPYLKEYKGQKGRWNNTDYYQLGYAYYKQGGFAEAVGEFNKIIDGNNAVSQNAYYHLAESYLKLGQKQQALNAFKNASEMDFSQEIKEDAWLNYAKVSYEIGNSYQSVPQVLSSFIKAYPTNKNNAALNDLLIDSYITSRNYKGAMVLLKNNKSFENKLAYQKVAFYRGIEVYNEGHYQEAKSFFASSLKEPREPRFTARATYWTAESDFQLSNFEEAGLGYKQFLQLPGAAATPEYGNIHYNIGYHYFKIKDYERAIAHFTKFTAAPSIEASRKKDAFLRLGDSYFMTSRYWPAMENYNTSIKLSLSDNEYAAFQKAISYGFVGKKEEKINALESYGNSYPTSIYRDDALYELGNTYLSQDRNQDASRAYRTLVEDQPKSSYVAKALLKQALILTNEGKSNEALSFFKTIADDFPSTPEAMQAVGSAKIIYIDQGRVDNYAMWVNTLDFVDIEDAELDNATYQAAEQPYLENKVADAIKRFEGYLAEFPMGIHAIKAHFYLGQLCFANEEALKAIPYFKFVVDKDRNEFTEQALARISEIYLGETDYKNALAYLTRLETEADFQQNIIFAQTNTMKASYELKNYAAAVSAADKVLQNTKIDNAIKSDAQIIIARSAIKTGDEVKAKTAYAEVSKIATGELAVEALFYDAYFKNKEGDFKTSNQSVQKLAKDYSGFKLYGAKGLIIMAKNFYGLGDAYQATYILDSVISNFVDFPGVIAEAQTVLNKIKTAEAKTNSSVEKPEGN